MGLKTVGTLTWEACKFCRHGIDGKCLPTHGFVPEFHCSRDSNQVSCTDYLSNDESEE